MYILCSSDLILRFYGFILGPVGENAVGDMAQMAREMIHIDMTSTVAMRSGITSVSGGMTKRGIALTTAEIIERWENVSILWTLVWFRFPASIWSFRFAAEGSKTAQQWQIRWRIRWRLCRPRLQRGARGRGGGGGEQDDHAPGSHSSCDRGRCTFKYPTRFWREKLAQNLSFSFPTNCN